MKAADLDQIGEGVTAAVSLHVFTELQTPLANCSIICCGIQYVVQKGLYAFKALITPTMDPVAAAMETARQTTLNICIATHLEDHRRILFCAMYIATGKYTVNGQNATAPRSPKTLLKNGSSMEINVVLTTKAVLHTSLNRFTL